MSLVPLAEEIGRDEAREIARRELVRPIYHRDDPSLVERIVREFFELLGRISERGADVAPGGWPGMAALLVLLVLLIIAIRLRLGALRRSHAERAALLDGHPRTAAEHRAAAERAAAAGAWAEAIRERLRAIARDLEERAIVEPKAGRTADELAAEAGAALPANAADLRAAAQTFDDVAYGGRPATAEGYERLVRLDEELRRAKPAAAEPTLADSTAAGSRQ
ncbi:MAG: DUF4129 domain-containing protein [Streptosporangiales bacterium]|nr:DUF4129 domain-containing protein [Streptosporangiales bacterium]